MALTQRSCHVLLVVMAALCMDLYQAQNFPARCICPTTIKFVKGNISDFQVLENRPGCDQTELIVTMSNPDNPPEKICINTEGKMGKAYLRCWERINKDESRRMECINRKRKTESKYKMEERPSLGGK
ncbi:uncharacterized protein ACBR49_001134 [Aulostomus maculatus]